MVINWATALLTAFITTTGTIIVAYVSHRLSINREALAATRSRDLQAVYVAVRLIGVLDDFARGCLDIVKDDGEYVMEDHGQEERHPTASYPTLTLPQDVDWKTVTTAFMYRALGMPSQIDAARRSITLSSEYSWPPDYEEVFEQRQSEYAKLGLVALSLSEDLRQHYKVPEKLSEDSVSKEEFEGKLQALELHRRAEDDRNKKRQSARLLV